MMCLTGDLGPAATTTYKRLASFLSTERNQPYGKVIYCVHVWIVPPHNYVCGTVMLILATIAYSSYTVQIHVLTRP